MAILDDMDEILIEEKKYVSSKQAAKMTGYAKDYIGQLCREGRVPARLIGRSWYVLEAAIQDHRFGNQETELAEKGKKAVEILSAAQSLVSTWESPRYEALDEELLPSINRLKDTGSETSANEEEENGQQEVSQHIQDSWKAWFDRFDHAEGTDTGGAEGIGARNIEETDVPESVIGDTDAPTIEPEDPEVEDRDEDSSEENMEEVNVPIHTVSRPLYHLPPEELLPHLTMVESPNEPATVRRKNKRGIIMTIQTIGAMLAIISVATAVVGSGYFDEYILSNSQVRMIAGVSFYNK